MKKIFMFLAAILTCSIAYGTGEIEMESGMTGFEIENNFKYMSLDKDLDKKTESLYEKYEIIKNNNNKLFNKIKSSSSDKENIYSIGYSGLKFDDLKSNGIDLTYITSYDDMRLGFNYNYSDLEFNSGTDGSLNQLNLFLKIEKDDTTFITSLYGGLIDDDRNSDKDNFIGFKALYENKYETYDETSYLTYLNFDVYRYKNQMLDTENDSISVEPGVAYIKEINDNFKLRADISYYHEFSDTVYDELKDTFDDSLNLKIGVASKIGIVELFPNYEFKKSLNDSNYSNNIGVTFKINI